MSRRGAAAAIAGVVIGAVAFLLVAASAQAPARSAAVEQQLRDVREHRDWLESQLAVAKARLGEMEAALLACGNRSPESRP